MRGVTAWAGLAVVIATAAILPVRAASLWEAAQEGMLTFSHKIPVEKFQEGDVLFQTSRSLQSRTVQLATHSPWSHCGMLYEKNKRWYVFEAVQPIKNTPLEVWIARGQHGRYVVKRLKNADQILTQPVLQKMRAIAVSYIGKPYDRYFAWSDDALYCSELIWKIYHRSTGIQIGRLQKMRDFDLTHPAVKKKLQERYGSHIPLEETVISPKNLVNSEMLETVYERL